MPAIFGDIYAAGDLLGDPIDTFTDEDVELLEVRDAGNDLGAGEFVLNRKNAHATAANLAWGNMVKFRIPTIQANPLHAVILAQSEDTLASEDEEGGEQIQRGGQSLLKLLSYARLPNRSYHGGSGFAAPVISGGRWTWTDVHPAAIFRRLLAEDGALDHPALWMLDPTFTISTSSAPESTAWPAFTGEFDFAAGDDFLSIYQALREAEDFDIWINPHTLDLNAYIDRGEDRSSAVLAAGKIRFQSLPGSIENNILTTLDRSMEGEVRASHAWVGGKENVWVLAERGSWDPGDPIRYIFIPYEKSRNPTTLMNAGIRALMKREKKQDSVEIEIDPEDDELAGKYLPWKHFRPGTDVTLHTGATPAQHDYNNVVKTVTAIKLIMDEATSDEDEGDGADAAKRRSLHVVVELDNENVTDAGTRPPGGGPGSQNPPTSPPPVIIPQPDDTITELVRWSFETNANDDTNTYGSGVVRALDAFAMPNVDWDGLGFGVPSNGGGHTAYIPIGAGETLTLAASIAWKYTPSQRDVHVRFYDDVEGPGVLVEDWLAIDGSNYGTKQRYEVSFTHPVPAGATHATIYWPSFAGIQLDNLVLGTVDSADAVVNDPNAVPPPGGTSPFHARSDDPRFSAENQHVTSHLSKTMTNGSGGDLEAGSVVIATDDNTFDTTAVADYAEGMVGFLLEDVADGEEGVVLWSGVTGAAPLINSSPPDVGDFLFTSTTPGGADASPTRATGAVGKVIAIDAAGATFVEWWGIPDGSSASLGLNDLSDVVIASAANGDAVVHDGTDWDNRPQLGALTTVFDGAGGTITTGLKGYVRVPYKCQIVRASLLADVSGSIVIDVWKDTYANFPPLVADTITASAKPTLASAQKSEDTTLTGWTTTLNEGDVLAFNVDSATTVTKVTLELRVKRIY